MTWAADLTYDLLDFDGDFLSGFEPAADSTSFADVLAAAGMGETLIDPGALDISAIANTFRWGRYVRVNQLGTARFTWRIEDGGPKRDGGDEQGYLALKGRGWISDWDYAVIRPAAGIGAVPAPDQRVFNFATPGCPRHAEWSTVLDRGEYGTVPEYIMLDANGAVAAAPINWAVPSAHWIWPIDPSNVAGSGFFTKSFNLSEETDLGFIATGDNYYTVYLDGVPILGEKDELACWMKHKRADKVIPAGEHIIAMVVRNPPVAGITNVAAALFACFTKNSDGSPDVIVLQSDTDWLGVFVPDGSPDPGWKADEIINTLLAEAQANSEALGWDTSFGVNGDGAGLDTAGEEFPEVPHIAFGVGDSLFKALQQLADQGWIDYHARPDTKVLDGWVWGSETSSAVILRDTANAVDDIGTAVVLDDPDHGGTEPRYNRFIVRYPGGYVEVDGDQTDGVFAAMLTADAPDRVDALRNGERALIDSANVPISYTVTPVDDPTTPYVGFTLRDAPQVPDAFGTLATRRTIAITAAEKDNEIEWEVTWNRRRVNRVARESQLLQNIGSGVAGRAPGSQVKTANFTGAAVPSDTPVLEQKVIRAPEQGDFPSGTGQSNRHEAVFNFPGLIDAADLSDPFPTRGSTQVHIIEVRWAMRVGTSGDPVEFQLEDDGFTGVVKSWSEDTGELRMVDNTESEGLDARSLLSIRITDPGSGDGEGLVVAVVYECCFPV